MTQPVKLRRAAKGKRFIIWNGAEREIKRSLAQLIK